MAIAEIHVLVAQRTGCSIEMLRIIGRRVSAAGMNLEDFKSRMSCRVSIVNSCL
jgi:hypothetical protein